MEKKGTTTIFCKSGRGTTGRGNQGGRYIIGKAAIGLQNFETVRTRNIFYVDKTILPENIRKYGFAFEGKKCLIGSGERKL